MLPRFMSRGLCASAIVLAFALSATSIVSAQDILKELEREEQGHESKHDHGHDHDAMPGMKKQKGEKEHKTHAGHQQTASHDMSHGQQDMHGDQHAMRGFLGPYPMTREGSGTSWVPDTTPHAGVHKMYGEWQTMYHALFNVAYDHQGGPRGGDKTFASGMFMGMAQRPLGEGTWGLRAMLSPDPFMGPNGYPLLLATGETANGRTPLIDRQHTHELFMLLATSYSYNFT
jgi:hypothetical protein